MSFIEMEWAGDDVRIQYGSQKNAPVFFLTREEIDQLHTFAHVNDEKPSPQAEVERLRVENERLRAEHDDLAQWLNIFQNIALERRRQDAKWGEQNHDAFLWLAILGEEFGEAAKAAVEGRIADLRTELIHVAAVAVAAIESLNRNELVEHRATHDVFKRSAYRVLELRSL